MLPSHAVPSSSTVHGPPPHPRGRDGRHLHPPDPPQRHTVDGPHHRCGRRRPHTVIKMADKEAGRARLAAQRPTRSSGSHRCSRRRSSALSCATPSPVLVVFEAVQWKLRTTAVAPRPRTRPLHGSVLLPRRRPDERHRPVPRQLRAPWNVMRIEQRLVPHRLGGRRRRPPGVQGRLPLRRPGLHAPSAARAKSRESSTGCTFRGPVEMFFAAYANGAGIEARDLVEGRSAATSGPDQRLGP